MAEFMAGIGKNSILMTAVTAWFTAQVLKIITTYWRYGVFDAGRLLGAGGMPSSHTALVVSLAVGIALKEGLESDLLAIAVILAGIVMYDAAGVRRAAGKQAKVINKLVREMRVNHKIGDGRLKELLGHTPLEVLGGAVHGTLIAYALYVLYR
ncbi:MAG: divergent PAP2 family protein [Sporomusa sp.]